MPRYDFRGPRLFLDAPLRAGGAVRLDASQAHYVLNVLRLKQGDDVLLFNGRDGEWRARVAGAAKRCLDLTVEELSRPQTAPTDLQYLFAPLKRTRLDYMVQKAVEMGVSLLQPVITRHTQAERVATARMRANAIEAAEQCGILGVPNICEPMALDKALAAVDSTRLLVFCDEDAPTFDPAVALRSGAAPCLSRPIPIAVLVGPEGGFSAEERSMLLRRPNIVRLALGPRILRADTAAVAALALVQTVLGDWRQWDDVLKGC